ncbi:TlpA family protein disulfide reductase [Niabella aurantiaca]|uniref:TlpA family protein disulfide reductase n=1 Tax=Niabella aurantiaca TaxID=379900 RepID=UPI0003802DD0|nr:redoxin family protein [Niabella aurantiaca]
MKKIALLSVTALLCYFVNTAYSQNNRIDLRMVKTPVHIGERISLDMPLGKFINYKQDVATLADFKNRLVILGFWFTHCTSCIAQFPKENALQQKRDRDMQLVLVTYEPETAVRAFIKNWEQKNNTRFILPIIVSDTMLNKSFYKRYAPHYIWLSQEGEVIAQTSAYFLNDVNLSGVAEALEKEKFRVFRKKQKRSTN